MGFGDKGKKEKAHDKASEAEASNKAATEDASWEDNEKGLKAKANRAAAKDAKADDAVRKAQEKKEREAEEAAELDAMSGKAAAKKKKDAPSKLTQAQIQRNLALMAAANSTTKSKKAKKTEVVEAAPVEANPNQDPDAIEARSVEEALKQLEIKDEKNEKWTYKKFEESIIDSVKADNPGLKRNQVQERCFKLWERSPLNPKNAA